MTISCMTEILHHRDFITHVANLANETLEAYQTTDDADCLILTLPDAGFQGEIPMRARADCRDAGTRRQNAAQVTAAVSQFIANSFPTRRWPLSCPLELFIYFVLEDVSPRDRLIDLERMRRGKGIKRERFCTQPSSAVLCCGTNEREIDRQTGFVESLQTSRTATATLGSLAATTCGVGVLRLECFSSSPCV